MLHSSQGRYEHTEKKAPALETSPVNPGKAIVASLNAARRLVALARASADSSTGARPEGLPAVRGAAPVGDDQAIQKQRENGDLGQEVSRPDIGQQPTPPGIRSRDARVSPLARCGLWKARVARTGKPRFRD